MRPKNFYQEIVPFILSSIVYLILIPFIGFPYTSFLKPIPMVCLLMITKMHPLPSKTSVPLRLAILSSLVGDIVLTFPQENALIIGISCFIIAHAVYINLFLRDYHFQFVRLIFFLLIWLAVSIGYLYVLPYMGKMAIPTLLYLIVLNIMVFAALQTTQQQIWIISGAILFLFSDSLLGINLYLADSKLLTIAVMSSYYLAQFLLVVGIIRAAVVQNSDASFNSSDHRCHKNFRKPLGCR